MCYNISCGKKIIIKVLNESIKEEKMGLEIKIPKFKFPKFKFKEIDDVED